MPTVKEKPEPVRRRGRYPKEYRRDVCALVLDQKRSVASVAKELGIAEQTIYLWLRQERIDRGEQQSLTMSEREELDRLRKEDRRLRQERDLLKKSTAFWVKEVGPMSRYIWVDAERPRGSRLWRHARRQRSPPRRTTTSRSERHRVPPTQSGTKPSS